MQDDTTWFWQIVDARGLADVSSDEFVALNELISKAERSEAELDAISAAIGSARFMDPPDGGDVSLYEQVRRMREALTTAESERDELLREKERLSESRSRWSRRYFEAAEASLVAGRERDEALRGAGWRPIETHRVDAIQGPYSPHVLCAHFDKQWRRFGRYDLALKRWYYSGTDERSQWAQVEGDEPTHWMPLPELSESSGRPLADAHSKSPAPSSQSERIAVLEAALRPFAKAADDSDILDDLRIGVVKEDHDIWESSAAMSITFGNLRDAHSTLAPLGEE